MPTTSRANNNRPAELSIAKYAEQFHPLEWRTWQDMEQALAICGGRGRRILHPGLGQARTSDSLNRDRAIRTADRAFRVLILKATKSLRLSPYLAKGMPTGGSHPVDFDLRMLAKIINLQKSNVALAGGGRFDEVRLLLPQEPTALYSSSKAEVDCRKWLVGEMRASPQRQPEPKRFYKLQGTKQFKGLSARAFDRAWQNAIAIAEAGWSTPGRLKESPRSSSR
jgi:hypothetical protein